jgi:hypothetical protein
MTNIWAGRRWPTVGVAALALACAGTLVTPAAQAASHSVAASGLWRPAIPGVTWNPTAGAATPAGPAAATWKTVPTPNPGGQANGNLAAVSCSSASACTAVGSYFNGAGTMVTLAERWNGTKWAIQVTPNSSGAGGSQLTGVSCLTADVCVAAGYDTDAAGTIVPLVETWNGAKWAIQAPPVPGGARASGFLAISCTSASACTATGDDTSTAGVSLTLAERWNGTKWTVQTTPNPSGAAASGLFAVSCATSTACTATGASTVSSGSTTTLAETWNGTKWSIDATPSPSIAGNQLEAVSCPAPAACTATGYYANASSGETMTLAERWNGTKWTVQTTPNPSAAAGAELGAVSCPSASDCTATGAYADSSTKTTVTLAETWNGTKWAVQATPNPSHNRASGLNGVSCATAGACATAGSYESPQGASLPLTEQRTGTGWKLNIPPRPSGAKSSELLGVSCSAASACTAVGDYHVNLAKNATLAERWNGTTWILQTAAIPSGAAESSLEDVSCPEASACTAVGDYQAHATGPMDPLAEAWNGSKWSVQATPNPAGAKRSSLYAVSCPAAGTCTAVGTYYNRAGTQRGFAEQWNGTSWRVTTLATPAGATTTDVAGVSCASAHYCVAVGYDNTSTGEAQPLAEAWNGTAWHVQKVTLPAKAQGATLSGVSCTAANACTAGGSVFAASGGPFAEHWNGTTWSYRAAPLPPNGASSTSEIGFSSMSCVAAQACVATGRYTPDNDPASFAEDWTGKAWKLQTIALPPGNMGSLVYGTSCAQARCTAVGSLIASSGQTVTLALGAGVAARGLATTRAVG